MYVLSVECTSVVHVVMLSFTSAGEGADSKFVPRRGVRSRAPARRAGQTRELTSGFCARNFLVHTHERPFMLRVSNTQHERSLMRVHLPANAHACLRHSRAHGQMCEAREVVPSHGEKSSDVSVFYVWRIDQDFGVSARILVYQVRLTYQPGF